MPVPCFRIVSFHLSRWAFNDILPQIVDAESYLFLIKNVIENDQAKLVVEVCDLLGIEVVDGEWLGEALFV